MNVLIIGGTGILSSAVVNECVKQGIDVTMINRGTRQLFINPNVELIKCDIRDKDKLCNLLVGRQFDCIIDFLVYSIEQLTYSLEIFTPIAKQYLFISSTAVYNTDKEELMDEEYPKVQYKWKYSINKYKCEQYLVDYSKKKNIIYTIVRPGVNYGNTRIPYGMYPPMGMHWTFIGRILSNKPIITWNNGMNRHNITRVEDFAQGIVCLLDNPLAFCQDFNVVGDDIYTWKDVLDTLGDILCHEVNTVDIPVDFYAKYINDNMQKDHLIGGRCKSCMTTNQKLKKICPTFTQKYSLKEGLRMTMEFYEKNNYLSGIDYGYDGLMDRILIDYDNRLGKCLRYCNYLSSNKRISLKNYMSYYSGKHFDSLLIRYMLKVKHLI